LQSYYESVFLFKRLATTDVSLQTNRGEFGFWMISPQISQPTSPDSTWGIGLRPFMNGVMARLVSDDDDEPVPELFGFRFESLPGFASVLFVPFWAMLLPFAAAGAFPWIKWRIGWRSAISAVCVLTTVLLIGVWFRSYKWMDITDRSSAINVCSMNGKLFVGETFMLMGNNTLNPGFPIPKSHLGICTLSPRQFELVSLGGGVALPYWLVVIVFTPLASAPWLLRWRFSLRTMLIATALLAVLLTLAIIAVRR
jgi:hypothetical protein